MEERLVNVSNALTAIEAYLDPLMNTSVDELCAASTPLEKAKLDVGLGTDTNIQYPRRLMY
jgi:hypothetical protein